MPEIVHIFWADEVMEHIAEHGVTADEAETVLRECFDDREPSGAGTGYWVVQGYTPHGRYLVVVFDYEDKANVVIPITAYEPAPEW